MEPEKIFLLLAKAEFRPFTEADWDGYAGCQSAEPLIANYEGHTLIIDGDCLQVFSPTFEVWQVSLNVEEI